MDSSAQNQALRFGKRALGHVASREFKLVAPCRGLPRERARASPREGHDPLASLAQQAAGDWTLPGSAVSVRSKVCEQTPTAQGVASRIAHDAGSDCDHNPEEPH